MARKDKINWFDAKKDYITDKQLTCVDIAKKYGVAPNTVKKHAKAEGWVKARQDILRNANEKVAEKVVDELTEVNERHTKAYKNLQAFALTNLNILYDHIADQVENAKRTGAKLNPREVYSSQQAKFLAETLRIAMDGERITLGLPTVVTKGEQDVNLKSEFADRPLDELERLYKAMDAPEETDSPTDREG